MEKVPLRNGPPYARAPQGPVESSQPRKKEELSKGYLSSHRKKEIFGLITFSLLWIFHIVYFLKYSNELGLNSLYVFLLGYLAADFASGFVHWLADTWGTVDWPIIGKTLIRPFREHHVDQLSITRHDFIETNGDSSLISLPLMFFSIFLFNIFENEFFHLSLFIFTLCSWVLMTNQIHKWAHQKPSQIPAAIRVLQKFRIILTREDHQKHHKSPYTRFYCITSGWLNYPFEAVSLFPKLEKLIHKITKAIPREDDLGSEAALKIFNHPSKQTYH